MVLLQVVTDVATNSVPVATGPPGWLTMLQGQFIAGVIVAIVTQVFKAVPGIPVTKGPRVAAVAALLSAVAGAIAAYAGGSLAGFDATSLWSAAMSVLITFTSATGTAEAAAHAVNLLAVRGPDGAATWATEGTGEPPPVVSG